ncbi:MAG: His/Gly/Thr/Pro-type tRNA ligase C-terminal domain-containing protein, partial [Thermoproteota archaeon]|nr:His/Gly/Thr/Pro-type tRNA ligase C-terminal domain-containing protein [Thermoproteota archaeon]
PFIRNSEFLWQEGHTAHTSEKEAEEQVMMILEIYKNLIEEFLLIPTITGFKSNKEKFVGAQYTTTLEGMMPDGKALQLGTSHNLGRNFSVPFEIKFLNMENKGDYVWQTSWGISWRLIGALIMVHGDDTGLVLPPLVAPIQIVIIPIYKKDNEREVKEEANLLKARLDRTGYRTFVDGRNEYTAGWKYNEWEIKGVPLRINIGQRDIENQTIEIVRRDNRHRKTIPLLDMEKEIANMFTDIENSIFSKAEKYLSEQTKRVSIYREFVEHFNNSNGFVISGWCGNEECENNIKQETGADIRVIPFNQQGPSNDENLNRCIYCNKKSIKIAVFGRAY